MKLTIIVDDKAVYEDGVCYSGLNLSTIPTGIHALQWDTVSNTGWIEFSGSSQPNQIINTLPSWGTDSMNAWASAHAIATAPPTTEQLIANCKNQAQALLSSTDWTEIPSVTNTSNPQYLLNSDAFIAYRVQIRALAINPVANPTFPTLPTEQWSS